MTIFVHTDQDYNIRNIDETSNLPQTLTWSIFDIFTYLRQSSTSCLNMICTHAFVQIMSQSPTYLSLIHLLLDVTHVQYVQK